MTVSTPASVPAHKTPGHWLVPALAAATLLPFVSGGVALLAGIAVALLFGNPYAARTKRYSQLLLTISVIGLGAGMDLAVVGRAGVRGLGYTVVGIAATLAVGTWLGRRFAVDRETSLLVTVGTAICGGSAIAAVAPTIRAKDHAISVALATVFMLNATALFVFPWIGHRLGLGQTEFGLWCALAIHDTSSVVGASMQYGAQALEVATTVKLARALWIIPVAFATGLVYARQRGNASGGKPRRPWFILGFVVAAALVTWVPVLRPAGAMVAHAARRSLVLTLFLIGTGMTRTALRSVGVRPLVQGVALWALTAGGTLLALRLGWIR
jgi:uncharacterized integral membrane protein (TIGR00698 family)